MSSMKKKTLWLDVLDAQVNRYTWAASMIFNFDGSIRSNQSLLAKISWQMLIKLILGKGTAYTVQCAVN